MGRHPTSFPNLSNDSILSCNKICNHGPSNH